MKSTTTLSGDFTQSENNNGVVNIAYGDDQAYFNATDIDAATLKKVASYNKAYISAAATAASEKALEMMQNDSDISKVVATFPFSPSKDGEVSVSIDRSKTFRVPAMNGGEAGEVTKSAIAMTVKDPFLKAKSIVKGLESNLTEALLK